MLALLAATAALFAAHEGRNRDITLAAGIMVGMGTAGLLLAPLYLGLVIKRNGVWHLLLATLIGATVAIFLPWTPPTASLPNLSALAISHPQSWALVAAASVGGSAWLTARASVLMPAALFAEARTGAMLLVVLLPLPIGVSGFALVLLVWPLPAPSRLHAANDDAVHRRTIRLAA